MKPNPANAQLLSAAAKLILPIGAEPECRMPAADRVLPDMGKRNGGTLGIELEQNTVHEPAFLQASATRKRNALPTRSRSASRTPTRRVKPTLGWSAKSPIAA